MILSMVDSTVVEAFGVQWRICRPFVGVDHRVFYVLPFYERNEGGSVSAFHDEVAAIIVQDETKDPWPIDSRPLIPHGRTYTLVETLKVVDCKMKVKRNENIIIMKIFFIGDSDYT